MMIKEIVILIMIIIIFFPTCLFTGAEDANKAAMEKRDNNIRNILETIDSVGLRELSLELVMEKHLKYLSLHSKPPICSQIGSPK